MTGNGRYAIGAWRWGRDGLSVSSSPMVQMGSMKVDCIYVKDVCTTSTTIYNMPKPDDKAHISDKQR